MTSEASELLGAYALGAVDPAERRRIEDAVASDVALRGELESLLYVVDVLDEFTARDALPPDPALWDRIESAIGKRERRGHHRNGGPATVRDGTVIPFRRSRRSRRFFAPIAAAAVLVLAVLSVRVVQLDADNRSLVSALDRPLVEAARQAQLDPSATLVSLSGLSGSAEAISVEAVYQPDGTGYVMGESLPELNPDQTYQLWAIVDDRVISAGVLGARPGVTPFQVVGDLSGLALTEEVAGGVVSSANDPVALWLADA